MSWVMVGVGVGSMALGAISSANAADKANRNADRQYIADLNRTNAQNDAIMEANLTNSIRTAYRVGIQQLQANRQKRMLAEQGYDIGVKGMEALGGNVANAAASGSVGSSVDAAADNIRKKQDDALLQLDNTFDETMQNAAIGIEQTVMQGIDTLRHAAKPNMSMPEHEDVVMAGLSGAAGSALSMYASGNISLGSLGSSSSSSLAAYSGVMSGGMSGSVGGYQSYVPSAGASGIFNSNSGALRGSFRS